MSSGSKKKSSNKKGGSSSTKGDDTNGGSNGIESSNNNESDNPLIRPSDNHSINPRSILTGFYQKNGKRVQHTVQDGALQMPKDSLDVIATATTKLGKLVAPNPRYELPGLDSVVRPSLDPKLETIVVTELVMEKVQIPQEQPPVPVATFDGTDPAAFQPPIIKMIKTSRPAARNKRIRRIPTKQAAVERIRGGGDEPPKQQAFITPVAAMATPPPDGQETTPIVQNMATTDAVMAPEAPLPETDPARQDTTSAIYATTAVVEAASTVVNSTNMPVPTRVEETAIDKNCGATPVIQQPPATDDIIAADFTPPKAMMSENNLPKVDPAPTATVPISAMSAPESTNPPLTNTPRPTDELPSNESGGQMEKTPSSKNEESTQLQPASLETPAVEKLAAPAASLSSEKAATESAAQMEGKDVTTDNSAVVNSSSQIKSVPLAQVHIDPSSSVPVAKVGEADTKPAPSVAPVVAVSMVASTENPVAENKEAVKNESSTSPSGATTTGSDSPQTSSAIPVIASSTSDTKPATAQVKEEEKKPAEKVPEAKALQSKPGPKWAQHKPGPNDETITPEIQSPPKPEWYKKDGINELERTMLPEWFDASSSHRTPESYIKTREKIIEMSEALSNRNVTNAMIRRSILGDAGSLQRLRKFLVSWGVINRDGINDSAPTTASLRLDFKKRSAEFTNDMRDSLILAVTEQASKKRKLAASPLSPTPSLSLDWEEIAARVGYGVSAENCRASFMTAPLKQDVSNAMDVTDDATSSSDRVPPEGTGSNQSQEQLIKHLVANSNPQVVKKVLDAAMEATDVSPVEARAASLLGLHLTQAVENARGHEVDLALRLSKLLDARMQKLENRMLMMDDVEGILEAEKVALEMERRDLYTARCRHWFGGV